MTKVQDSVTTPSEITATSNVRMNFETNLIIHYNKPFTGH